MCGIAGALATNLPDQNVVAEQMADALSHRGPDAFGIWCDPEAGILLAHRRLSILDLSANGAQPMVSTSGRYRMSYNGEIYNFGELRAELESLGAVFRGSSDTEIMLAAFDFWGVVESVKKFNGIFAFAVWDESEQTLLLGRDHVGVKPLYFSLQGGACLFGSELKALFRVPGAEFRIDTAAVSELFCFGYIESTRSIFRQTRQVDPATIERFRLRGGIVERQEPIVYWSWQEIVRTGQSSPHTVSPESVVDQLDSLLKDVISMQMISDRAVGAFLSGGIDSSCVVAIMQHVRSRPVKTFSIGFEIKEFDESKFAEGVARHLGTDHNTLIVTENECLDIVPRLPQLYDEPFGDSSAVPVYFVSKLARESVVVSLSGEGGDELFGGYPRYYLADRLFRAARWTPTIVARCIEALALHSPDAALRLVARMLPTSILPSAERVRAATTKLGKVLQEKSLREIYSRIIVQFDTGIEDLLARPQRRDAPVWELSLSGYVPMMLSDALTYLPHDILTKVDRATMSVSLEGRVPLLDPRIIEFAAAIPHSMLTAGGKAKRPLRDVLARYVPPRLFDRPKMGFGVPVEHWLRGPLRSWGEELMSHIVHEVPPEARPDLIQKAWREYQQSRGRWQPGLWAVLMFLAWKQAYRGQILN